MNVRHIYEVEVVNVSVIRKIESPINERLRKRHFMQTAIWIVFGAIVSFGLIFFILSMMEMGRVNHWFGWSWGPKPDGENVVLRALIINAVQLSVLLYRMLFRGYDLVSDRERVRLYVINAFLAGLSWLALLLKYFQGPTIDRISQIVGLIGLIGIPLTIYSFVLMVQLYQKVDDRLRRERKLSEQYYEQLITDQLTGLPNRILFQDHLTQALAEARQYETRLAVLFIDLDRFKYINDTLGHKVGDLLLLQVVERLRSCLRDDEALYRLGGDEFIIVEEHTPDKRQAIDLAENILSLVDKPYMIEGHELFISASIGISWYPEDGEDMETLFKNADMAMYRAKEQGRNNYQVFDVRMNDYAFERLQLEKDLRKALEREEFLVYYQPQIHISTGRIIGMEALVRWQHPQRGMVSPGQFIPLAEETKLIIPIGEWVLRTACAQNKAWQDAGFPHVRVSVNLSAHQFLEPNLAQMVKQVLEETGLAPEFLDLEITESITMNNIDRAIATMHELASLGIQISIDDFGTGYSSLSYLKKFPIHTLKIDQSFVRDIPNDSDDGAIATAIIAMAHSLNLNVIAEGVETADQLEFLGRRGCDEMQGYLVSRPVPAIEFENILNREMQANRIQI